MRKRTPPLSILLLSAICLAQQTSSTNQGTSNAGSTAKSAPITVIGCVSGLEGVYTLGSETGNLYRLAGDRSSFRRYVGQTVRITGTESPSSSSTTVNESLKQKSANQGGSHNLASYAHRLQDREDRGHLRHQPLSGNGDLP